MILILSCRRWLAALAVVSTLALAEDVEDAGLPDDAGVLEVDAGVLVLEVDDAGVADDETEPDAPVDAGSAPVQRETVVVADRYINPRRVAGSAQVVTEQQLTRRESNDIHRVLEEVPGVYVREEDGFGLRPNIGLRGAQSDRSSKVALMEDGILFAPAPYSAPAAYYFPMVTRMTSVEVYKGPAAIRFGPQTVGGAINLRTREIPHGFASDLDLSVGTFQQLKAAGWMGWSNDRWGVLVDAVHLENSGFKVIDNGGDTGFHKNELMGKAFLNLGPGRFNLKLGLSEEVSHETYMGISDADFAVTPYRRYFASKDDLMSWYRTQAVLSYDARLGEHVKWVTTLYRNDMDRTWHRVNGFRGRQDLSQMLAGTAPGNVSGYLDVLRGVRDSLNADEDIQTVDNHRVFISEGAQSIVDAKFETGPLKHELEAGARFHFDQIHRLHTSDYWRSVSETLVATGEPTTTLTDDLDGTWALAGWVADSIQWGRVLLAPGVRVEKVWTKSHSALTSVDAYGEQLAVLPGIGGVVSLPWDVDVLAGVHRGYSPVAPGNSGVVDPEFAWNVEAGARLSKRRFKAEVTGFYSDYSNLLSTCSLAAGCLNEEANIQYNGGNVIVYGVEAMAKALVPLPAQLQLGVGANYTFTDSQFLSSFVSQDPSWGVVEAGYRLPLIPQHRAETTVSLEHARFDFGVGVSVQSDLWQVAAAEQPIPSQVIPGRVLVDAFLNVHATDFLTLYLDGTNLTDSKALAGRAPFGARPVAPLQLQFGMKLKLR